MHSASARRSGRVCSCGRRTQAVRGPPLAGSFETLLGTSDAEKIEAAIAAYRHRFERVGIFENTLYPDIAEMLAAFDAASHQLCGVTVKPRTAIFCSAQCRW
jgi:phosphoglycolate phosphatase-like HAD superfamily hydrolase